MNAMNVKHFQTLDAFRGICACLVALFHFHANSIIQGAPIFQNAAVYVDFFFVLSGFVIFANYEDRLKNGYKISKFILLRFGRLWPLHIAVFLAFILVDVAQMFIDVGDAAKFKPFSAPGEGLDAIIANIFMVHSLGILDQLSFNGPSWSISVEFYTYIIFALILSTFKHHATKFIVLLCAVSVFILFYFYGSLYAKYDYGIFRCIFGFSFGAFTWRIYNLSREKIGGILESKSAANVSEFALISLVLLCVHYLYAGFSSIVFPPLFALVILIFSHEAGALSRFLNKKPFQILGMLSYSIYMIHIFISGKLFELPVRILEQKTDLTITVIENGRSLYGQNLLQGTFIEVFYLLVVIAGSFISYKLIEDPGRTLAKKLAKKIYDQQPKQ